MNNDQEIPFGNESDTEGDSRGNTSYKRSRRENPNDNYNNSEGSSYNRYDSGNTRSNNYQNRDRMNNNRQGTDNRNRPNNYGWNNNYRDNNNQGGNYNRGNNYRDNNNQGGNYNRGNNYRDNNNQGGNYNRGNYRDYNNQGGSYNRGNYRDNNQGNNYNQGGNYNNQGGNYNRSNYRDYNNQGGGYNRGNYRDNNQGGNYNRGNNYRDNNNQGGNYSRGNYRDNNQGGGYNRDNRDNRQMNRRPNTQNRQGGGPGGPPNRRGRFNNPKPVERLKRPQPRRPRFTPLVKVLRGMGFASPRICVEIVRSGRVFVNGEETINPNLGVNLRRDDVRIDGFNLNDVKQSVYLVINKQKNVAGSKEHDENSIFRQFRIKDALYFPFGCLDKSSSGLVFATNDPRFKNPDNQDLAGIPLQYRIKVNKALSKEDVNKIAQSFASETHDGNSFHFLQDYSRHSWIMCSVSHTKPTIIRSFLKRHGLEVLGFERYSIGSITSDLLQRGMWTRLTSKNVEKMMNEPISIPDLDKNDESFGEDSEEHPSFKKRVQSLYRHWFIK